MITEYVLFNLRPGMRREQVAQEMRDIAPRWRGEPGLIRKTFIYDAATHQAGAFYLWERRSDAQRAHDEAWRARIRNSYGSEPEIRYFDTPLVVDNALGETIEAGGWA